MTKPYLETIARMAYVWGWPLVNMANRRAAFSKAPEPGLLGGVVPVAYNCVAMLTGYIAPNQRIIACPNQDVAYGAGFFELDKSPSSSKSRTSAIVFGFTPLYDMRTDEFSEIGKEYDTKPGFYLIVGPNWTGETPDGITAVVRSSTPVVFALKATDWSKLPHLPAPQSSGQGELESVWVSAIGT